MQRRIPGSPHVTQDINGCFSKIDRALIDFTAFSLMERPEVMRIPLTRTVVVVDATGEEHNMLLEHCCSLNNCVVSCLSYSANVSRVKLTSRSGILTGEIMIS